MKHRFIVSIFVCLVLLAFMIGPVLAVDQNPASRSQVARPPRVVYNFLDPTPVSWGGTTASTSITVSGVTGNVTDVNIVLYGLSVVTPVVGVEEFDILLVPPSGAANDVILMSFACDATFGPITVTFDMAAAGPMPDGSSGTPCTTGSYTPSDYSGLVGGYILDPPAPAAPYGTDLSVFNGLNPNGTWTLYYEEFAGNEGGQLTGGWEIVITDDTVLTTLAASAACNGDNLAVTISSGDAPFNITGTGPGLPATGVGAGVTSLTGPGAWTGVTVTETTGDLESLVLGSFACPAAPVGVPGIPVPHLGLVLIDFSRTQAAYQEPGGEPIGGVVLPADADGNGFDTYVVTEIVYVGGQYWLGLFLGSANWGYVPLAGVLPLTELDLPEPTTGDTGGADTRN